MKQEKFYLGGKLALELRGLGHHLKPTAMVGKEGVTPTVLEALEAVLTAHELVKVKLQEGCSLERAAAAEMLAEGSKARIVQVIGHVILLYRPKPPEKEAPAAPGNPGAGRSPRQGNKGRAGSGRGKSGAAGGPRSGKAAAPRGGRAVAGTAGKAGARRRLGRASGKR